MATSNANTTIKVEADSELIKNQKHAVLMSPQKNFQVLQTADGDAIFYSVGSDGVFYVAREVRKSKSGWNRTDLSSSLKGKAKRFTASQNPGTLAIDVALVMSLDDGNDLVHLSRNNLISSNGWEKSISWQSVVFDDTQSSAPLPLIITDMYMLTREGKGKAPGTITWFVDIVKDPASKLRLLDRYYIEPDSSPKWHKHILPNDVEEGSIISCLGRRQRDYIDGIYTLSKIGNSDSLIFTQSKNIWSPRSPPISTVLGNPKGATGISSCVSKDELTSLFVAGDDGLYLFNPDGQESGLEPIQVIPSLLWGLNRSQNLVYATCPIGKEAKPSSWSPPMQICTKVLQFAFYLNQKSAFNVLFALFQDQSMLQFVQDASTGIWNPRKITLPTTDVSHMVEVNTFTTHVKCTDQNGLPAIGAPIRIESMQTVPLTVNRSYCKIGLDSPIEIESDGTGSDTIIQETNALPSVCFKLISGNQTLKVDPQSKIAKKLSNIKSGRDLDVQIPDSNGKMKLLVPGDVSKDNRDEVAKCIPKLMEVRSSLPTYGSLDTKVLTNTTRSTGDVKIFRVTKISTGQLKFCEGHEAHAILNLFQFLKNVWDDVQGFWTDVVDNVTRFIARIGDMIYTAILDTVEAVSSAIEFLFTQIKVFFEDLVAWLGFIFNWDDIVRTHRVIKNIAKQYTRNAVDQLDTLRGSLENGFKDLRGFINGKSWDKANVST
ncbi:uncharacterized protein N7483_000577 [Penicillium malachiteum]|uniref:uncharacterized protein n=1 Tax=Penicillium malachiteum TaxID=1324776 RepID=UPI0025466B94|nr:uncharacterized protein N7483_000577 [Penicillium malachiteum]KAJ5735452.1 hypothetical protein N7483_000577 [Penicillium malachiteum]